MVYTPKPVQKLPGGPAVPLLYMEAVAQAGFSIVLQSCPGSGQDSVPDNNLVGVT